MDKDFRMSNVFSAMNDMICDIDLGVGFEEKSMSDYYHEAVGRNKIKPRPKPRTRITNN